MIILKKILNKNFVIKKYYSYVFPNLKVNKLFNNLILMFLLIILFSIPLLSQENNNPFYGSPDSSTNIKNINRVKPLFRDSKFYREISSLQKKIRNIIADNISNLNNKDLLKFLFILFLAFIYGVIHAMGPGHRKTVLFSYFLANEAKPFDGIMMGFLLSIIHAGSAIILILSLYFFLQNKYLESKIVFESLMEKVSYISIVILGILLLIFKIISTFNSRINKINSDNEKPLKNKTKSSLPFILLSGIVPCPGAMTILIFAIAANQLYLGIFSVIAMSFGMAVTISILSVFAIIGKTKILKLTEENSKLKSIIFNGIEFTGILIILIFGLIMVIPYF